jgi:hypothetical protein
MISGDVLKYRNGLRFWIIAADYARPAPLKPVSSDTSISMDGKGRFLDNIFIERLWRTQKYECVYLHA